MRPVERVAWPALLGSWTLDRRIVDRRLGTTLRFIGLAETTATSDGSLRWLETGELRAPTGTFEVRRAYRYAALGSGLVEVALDDGSVLGYLSLRHGRGRLWHRCGADDYAALYLVEEDRVTQRWRVRGPEKDYVTTTVATRP